MSLPCTFGKSPDRSPRSRQSCMPVVCPARGRTQPSQHPTRNRPAGPDDHKPFIHALLLVGSICVDRDTQCRLTNRPLCLRRNRTVHQRRPLRRLPRRALLRGARRARRRVFQCLDSTWRGDGEEFKRLLACVTATQGGIIARSLVAADHRATNVIWPINVSATECVSLESTESSISAGSPEGDSP